MSPGRPPGSDRDGLPRVGQRLGKYLLTAQLGQGTEGHVFRALHTGLNLDRAIKILVPRGANRAQQIEQLKHEARLLCRIEHPHIVRVYDLEEDGERPFFVMELVEGLNLAELITQSGRIAAGRAVDLVAQVAAGLKAANAFGIVHRDVKPANILLTKDGTAKLSDLGTGLLIEAGATQARGPIVGTPYYMAPEQLESAGPIDHRADIYALGSTFYHAVTGHFPFDAASMRELLFKKALAGERPDLWVPPEKRCPDIRPELSAVITKLMAPKPADRYASYEQLLQVLASVKTAVAALVADPGGLMSTAGPNARRTQQLSQRLTAASDPRLPALAAAVKVAMDALARGDKVMAREAILPHRESFPGSEAVWLLLAKSADSHEEAVAYVEAGLRAAPMSDRLKALGAALAKDRPAPPRKCLFCSAPGLTTIVCPTCGGLSAFPLPPGYPTAAPARVDLIQRAIGAYERALRGKPDPRWEYALGLAHMSLARPQDALPHFQAAAKAGMPVPPDRLAGLEAWVAEAAATTHRVRIAVVDDSPTIRKLVQAKLAEFDFTVLPLADGDEAIARLPEFKPHLVLMDINMPGKDGYQMCRWVKAHKTLRDTPVVMLSGDDGFFDKVRGRMAGASRHIGKPFNTDELLQVIDSLCAKARRAK
jgi:CheY-like chemotaxis protein